MSIEIPELRSLEMVVSLGSEYRSYSLFSYLFTDSVNTKTGRISYPYPYEAYLTITHSQETSYSGYYDFSARFTRNTDLTEEEK